MKTSYVSPNGEITESDKGNHMYTIVITSGSPWAKLPSKGMVKRIFFEMMVVYRNEGISSTRIPNQLALRFRDSEEVKGISNELFPW